MFAKTYSGFLKGMEASPIEIEVVSNKGLRTFNIVGLADKAIDEAKERINSAIKHIGLLSPSNQTQRILVNLSPANIKKQGSLYDLPIALAYLLSTNQAKFDSTSSIIAGELALNGQLKPITGALPLSLLALEKNFSEILLPKQNAKEAYLANLLSKESKIKVIGIDNLKQAIDYLEGTSFIEPISLDLNIEEEYTPYEVDFAFVKGQQHSKRGLEIAAAGAHNVFLEGPPGTGKTLLAKAMVSILPKLEPKEILELTKIYSISGLLKQERPFVSQRPFRCPHHSSSESALIGGGSPPRPGEITLSHRGILFLDEFPEFHRDVLESLRQPLESGEINILRANHNLNYPANFTLIAASNPCPCGFYNHPEKKCTCTSSQVASYKRKLSGPLIDRMDIFCWVAPIKYEELSNQRDEEASNTIKKRVEIARRIQKQRFKDENILTNSEMSIPLLKKYCPLNNQSQLLIKKHINSGNISARGYHRILKVARTIADLEENEDISFENLNEAIIYRKRDIN